MLGTGVIAVALTAGSILGMADDAMPPVSFPENGVVSISPSGNYLLDGRPRFLIGAQIPEYLKPGIAPTEGYPKEQAWLYEEVLNYRNAQRIGFDSVGYFTVEDWMFQPDGRQVNPAWSKKDIGDFIADIHLPLYVDFTCFPWSHGKLAGMKQVPPAALNEGGSSSEGNHWVPYSVNSPEGRAIYEKLWLSGAKHIKESGGKALFYELFNEPAYNDRSPYNRKLFADLMKGRYGSIESLNADWHSNYADFESVGQFKSQGENPALFVEWCKFMEDSFADLCKFGVETVRKVDPSAHCCVQALGGASLSIPRTNINLYKIGLHCDTVSTPTGGSIGFTRGLDAPATHAIDTAPLQSVPSGLLERRFYLSLAKGKPLHDGEMYSGATRESLMSTLWLEAMRGLDASYFFVWTRRSWDHDWQPAGSGKGGRKVAEKFGYLMLNPYAVEPDAMPGIMEFKREYLLIDDIFQPRENRVRPQIALLISFPTMRYSIATGGANHKIPQNYSAALDFSHQPYDVVLEEQLPEGRLDGCKVLLVPGVSNILPETAKHVGDFVRKGGVLVLGSATMSCDEHGNPLESWEKELDLSIGKAISAEVSTLSLDFPQPPELPGQLKCKLESEINAGGAWQKIGSVGQTPAILKRDFGKGRIYFVGAKMPDYSLAGALGGILLKEGVSKPCILTDSNNGELEPNVEMHVAQSGTRTGVFLYNWDSYPKLANLKINSCKNAFIAIDPFAKEMLPQTDGTISLLLPPHKRVVTVCGSAEELAKLYGGTKNISVGELRERLAQTPHLPKPKALEDDNFSFKADLSKTRTLDLRSFVNRHFEDSVPGDGKGGWTDQGRENSLFGVPWGITTLCGVPFDLIRFDQNENKTCLVLASQNIKGVPLKVEGIPVDDKVKAIYFLHSTAWEGDKNESFHYIVEYADGSKDIILIRNNIEVADWWFGKTPKQLEAKKAWHNSDNRGLYAYKWTSPHPEKTVQSISVESANGPSIPLIVAITIETP